MQRFKSDEATTLASAMHQLARFHLKDDEKMFQYFIRAQA